MIYMIYDIYKTKLQIIRWNKSIEASTENDQEKQKGLNIGKKTTCHDRSLTPIILHSITGLSHPSYYDKIKRTNKKEKQKKDWTSEK